MAAKIKKGVGVLNPDYYYYQAGYLLKLLIASPMDEYRIRSLIGESLREFQTQHLSSKFQHLSAVDSR